MKKFFLIAYTEKKKYGVNPVMHNLVSISKPTGNIGVDAKTALGLFINSTGSLKKNEIISIQELDDRGFPVGELITPMENSTIVPTGKQRR